MRSCVKPTQRTPKITHKCSHVAENLWKNFKPKAIMNFLNL